MTTRRKFSISAFVVAAFFSGILFTTAGANWLGMESGIGTSLYASEANRVVEGTSAISNADSPVVVLSPATIDDAFVSVADLVNPTVVQIHSEVVQERTAATNPFDNFFNFPGQNGQTAPNAPTEFRTSALGSGVIISSEGHIATNYHVIKGAETLEVMLFNGEYYNAKVIGSDPNSDLAVIQIDKQNLPAITFGNATNIRVGQWVMAFGSPMAEELGNTVTSGIVSAVRRTSSTLAGLNMFSSFIQTDAAINPGNSGGALVNLNGQLIGLNSAILSRSGGSQGIGFAIPVDVVQNITTQLIEVGRVERGFLGVNFDRVSPTLAKALDVPRGAAQVTSVTKDAPAYKAGLQDGDIIVAVNGINLNDFNELRTTIANLAPGITVTLEIARDTKREAIHVTLGKRSTFVDEEAPVIEPIPEKDTEVVESLGLQLESLSPQILDQLGVDAKDISGVVVRSVDQNSAAFREGDLRQGDIIAEINRVPITSKEAFLTSYGDINGGSTFLIKAYRISENPDRTRTLRSFLTALTKPE